jgi:methane/ammonia monooxygenase subunit C
MDGPGCALHQGNLVSLGDGYRGPLMSLPDVALNEWGHAFWFMEELFRAPLALGFRSAGVGRPVQIIARFSNLLDVQWNKQSREILNDVV